MQEEGRPREKLPFLRLRSLPEHWLLAFIFFLTAPAAAPAASDFELYQGQGIVIRYERPLGNAASQLAALYPGMKAEVEKKIGYGISYAPAVVLVRDDSSFRKRAGNELVTAFAVPSQRLIVIDYAKMERTPFDLRATFEHELCHLLLHDNPAADLPKWLDEGVAQWASGGVADIVNPGARDVLKQAVLSGGIIPLRDLSSSFPDQNRELILAYEESRSVVEFIVQEYGEKKLQGLLRDIRTGKSIEEAIGGNLPLDQDMLERRWREGLARKYSWPQYAADHIYWVLFFAAALATLIGYLRTRKRMRDYRDTEEGDGEEKP